jgi:hypothetical protein
MIFSSPGHQCERIQSPINGAIQCTGNTTDHSCKFNCYPGYDLRGSSNRLCNASGKWTGDETLCKSKFVPMIPMIDVLSRIFIRIFKTK